MTRNQMVRIIAEHLYGNDPLIDYTDYKPYNVTWQNLPSPHANKFLQDASDLLQKMEDNGIKPPTITILPDSYNRSEGSYGFEVNEWEEEVANEAK